MAGAARACLSHGMRERPACCGDWAYRSWTLRNARDVLRPDHRARERDIVGGAGSGRRLPAFRCAVPCLFHQSRTRGAARESPCRRRRGGRSARQLAAERERLGQLWCRTRRCPQRQFPQAIHTGDRSGRHLATCPHRRSGLRADPARDCTGACRTRGTCSTPKSRSFSRRRPPISTSCAIRKVCGCISRMSIFSTASASLRKPSWTWVMQRRRPPAGRSPHCRRPGRPRPG